jgi:hypothetical protein
MLFLYGDLGTTDDFMDFIDTVLTPLSNENVKWVQDVHSSICHFSSHEDLGGISELLHEILDDKIAAFFLFEVPFQFGMRMDTKLMNHLFDLTTDTGYFRIRENQDIDDEFLEWNKQQIQDLGFKDERFDFTEEDESPNDVRKIKQTYVEPLMMDAILDKIASKGIESLTVEEKKYLKNLSD